MRRIAVAVLLLTTPALAQPPNSADVEIGEHAWWECHVQPATKVICCRESDGHVLNDDEWRTVARPDGEQIYQVHVSTRWYDVPQQTVINDVRDCGPEPDRAKRSMAKVWYARIWNGDGLANIKIFCFMVGTMY